MKKLGFGFMRLPKLKNGEVDVDHTRKMVDSFMEAGFTYFDTAHVYVNGKSEELLRELLTGRYPRDSYILTNKLTPMCYESKEEIVPLMEKQLELCGVEYFDYGLLHSVMRDNYEKFTRTDAFGQMLKLKEQGKLRHLGISFHDSPEFLEKVLTEHPEIEAVQIQFNYLDMDNPLVQSRGCYDVCVKYGKSILVMEPVKGGSLADLPPEAAKVLDDLGGGSHASYAIRFAASQEQVMVVLSGMSNMEQLRDNMEIMDNFRPIDEREEAALEQVRKILAEQGNIQCTACRYCVDGCPQNILIPDLFTMYNGRSRYLDHATRYTHRLENSGKAGTCIGCGQCEEVCPQHLPIREYLAAVAQKFET